MMTDQDSWERFDAQVESKCRRTRQALEQFQATKDIIAELERDIALSDLETMGVVDITRKVRR